MKKWVISLVALLSLTVAAVPVFANGGIKVTLNGLPSQQVEGVQIGDSVYVPVRAFAALFNGIANWNQQAGGGGEVVVDTYTMKRPEIRSTDPQFIKMINDALDLLEQKDFAHYDMICDNVHWFIPQTPESAEISKTYAAMMGWEIEIGQSLIKDPQRYNPQFLAGALAHEAAHSAMFSHNIGLKDRPGSEKMAYEHEIAAFNLIGAPQWMIDEARKTQELAVQYYGQQQNQVQGASQ